MACGPLVVVLVVINLLSSGIAFDMQCPPNICYCKVENGTTGTTHYVTQCSNSSLTEIPLGIDSRTSILNVSHSNISHLGNGSLIKDGVLHVDKVFYKMGRGEKYENGVLKRLSSLSELHLESNVLASMAPGALYGNPNLVVLKLRNNSFSSLPIDIISLKNHIKEVDISDNAIKSIDLTSVRKYYPELKRLDVSKNKITHFVSTSPVDKSSIEIIDASQNYVVFLNNTFSNMSNLKEVNVSNNEISSLSPDLFSSCPNLVKVDISRNHILVIHRDSFNNNPKITEVNAGSNKLTFVHPDTFSKNRDLTKVTLSWNDIEEVHPGTFINNPNLESIDFNTNKIKTLSPETFKNNPRLKSIDLRSNSLLTIHRNMFQSTPQLEHLLLSKNEHVRFHDGFLLHATTLKVFDAQHCNLTNLPLGFLNKSNNLQELNLANNNLTSLDNITDLQGDSYNDMVTRLEILDLSNNRLRKINVEVFKNKMTNLKQLRIAGNNFLCDCKLRSLWLWSQREGIIPSNPQIMCNLENAHVPWDNVQHLNCSDEALLAQMGTDSSETGLVTELPPDGWYKGNHGHKGTYEHRSEKKFEERSNKIMVGVSIFILLAVVLVILPLLFFMRKRYGSYKVSKPKNRVGNNTNNNNDQNGVQHNGTPSV